MLCPWRAARTPNPANRIERGTPKERRRLGLIRIICAIWFAHDRDFNSVSLDRSDHSDFDINCVCRSRIFHSA
jgi:hypothetical protein